MKGQNYLPWQPSTGAQLQVILSMYTGTAPNDAFNHRRAKVQLQICIFGSKLITRFNEHDYQLPYLLPSVTARCKPNTSQI